MTKYSQQPGPIGVFDSGYGGLTILHGIRQLLPEYDYVYLGDNARAPYGSRSFDIVYQFTRQAVMKLFGLGCQLVILGCNTDGRNHRQTHPFATRRTARNRGHRQEQQLQPGDPEAVAGHQGDRRAVSVVGTHHREQRGRQPRR